ncbi:MAG: hypothetical protein V1647_04540 [Pseudomonadota bacterium]
MKVGILFLFAVVLMVNNSYSQTIATKEDVAKFKKQLQESGLYSKTMTDDFLLQRIIDFKLVVMEAKNTGADKEEGAMDAMDRAIYTYYINKMVDYKFKNKKFSNKEISDYYRTNPLVKIQRITYVFDPKSAKSKDKAKTQISILRSEIRSKQLTFEEAIEKTEANAAPGMNGTFDKALSSTIPVMEWIQIKDLQPMELSPVIQLQDCLAVTRVLKIYPFSSEFARGINAILVDTATSKARDTYTQSLRQKYGVK